MPVNRRSKKKAVYNLKKGAHNAARNVVSAFGIFLIMTIITGGFIAFQWKNVQINQCLRDNEKLKTDILMLNAKKIQLETERNTLRQSVPLQASSRFGMLPELNNGKKLNVDKNKMVLYEEKDRQVSE